MNMAAPSGVMTIGADVSVTRMAAEGKSLDAGKTFAASLDERIAADEDATKKSSAELIASQAQAGVQMPVSGVAQGAGHETVAAMKVLQAPDSGVQEMSMLLAKGAAVTSSALLQQTGVGVVGDKAPVAVASSTVATQGMQAKSTAEGLASGAELQGPGDADVKLPAGAIAAPDAAAYAGNEQSQGAKVQPTVEMPQSAQAGTSAAATVAGANAQVIHLPQEHVPAGSEKSVATDSGEKVDSAKGTTKKHAAAKTEASTKTVEAGANIGVLPGAIYGAVGMAVAANPVITSGSMDATAQTAPAQPASKQEAAVAVTAGTQAVLTAGGHPSAAPSRPTEKAHGDGVEVSSQAETGAHVVQKDAQAPAKTGDASLVAVAAPSAAQTVKPSAKMQAADAVAAVSHSAGAAGAMANAAGASTALQAPGTAVQKSVPGDATATLLAAHSGNGELTGASGAQTAMSETHRTLVATPTVLEVGIPNGTQGWLKVRAELTGGGVNASLSAASSAGQEMLHRELPALTTYLQQEKVAVNSVVVQAPVAGGFRGPGTGAGGFTGGQTQQQNQGGGGRESFVAAGRAGLADTGVSGVDEVPAALQYTGGGWLSVRA